MANLRDLISYADRDEVIRSATGLSTNTGAPPNYPGSAYKQIKYRGSQCTGTLTCYYECLVWTPPAGTTFIKFELWGGGGGGPGTCCCMHGTPGGSGAYAYKCICTGNDLGGCTYEFCVAGMSCCSPINVGYRGCKTYITGYNLENLCAEGGGPGGSTCSFAWDTANICNYDQTCSESMRSATCQWCTGPFSNQSTDWACSKSVPGPYGSGTRDCFQEDTRSGVYDLIGIGNTFGSCGERVKYDHALNPCYGGVCYNCYYCAPFFGADGGAHGLPGGLGAPCNTSFDYCIYLQYLPYPGGLINTRGGWIPRRNEGINLSGGQGAAQYVNSFFGYSSSNREHGIPGMGAPSANSSAGNCYCGGPGHSGQIIITYG
jgi:hypothetical protein